MLPRIQPLFNDLPSSGPDISDAGACFGCCDNLFTGRCLTVDAFAVFAVPAFSHCVTIF
jgi:hypothetical protein